MKKIKPICPVCHKSFKPTSNIKMHMKDSHGLSYSQCQVLLNKNYVENNSVWCIIKNSIFVLTFIKIFRKISKIMQPRCDICGVMPSKSCFKHGIHLFLCEKHKNIT